MHSSINDSEAVILRGTNVRKMHSSARDAFKPVNVKPVAHVNFESKKIDLFQQPLKNINSNKKVELKLSLFKENLKIGWIKSRPGMLPEELDVYKKFDALILEGTGLGHFPITEFDAGTKNNALIFKNLKELSKKIVLIMTSQTIFGRVNLNVYSPARKLKELGVLGHNSAMSPETTYIKTAWLLSNFKKEEVKNIFNKNFVGEIVTRIEGDVNDA
jgi:glutamyl-tRNA(Gln) amidotransferase subunit D